MRKRGLCCGPVSVRTVRLFVTFVHSIQTAEDIVKVLCRPGSTIILFFWFPAMIPNSKRYPLQRGRKIQGGGKIFAIVDWNRRLCRKRYEIVPCCYGRLIGSHIRSFSDLGPVFKVTAFLMYRTLIGNISSVSNGNIFNYYYYYRVLRAICCQPVDGSLICFI